MSWQEEPTPPSPIAAPKIPFQQVYSEVHTSVPDGTPQPDPETIRIDPQFFKALMARANEK